jgi:hypothetical protein
VSRWWMVDPVRGCQVTQNLPKSRGKMSEAVMKCQTLGFVTKLRIKPCKAGISGVSIVTFVILVANTTRKALD